LKQNSN